MKILQVSNKPPYPPRDGGSIAMFNLMHALGKLGHDITVLTMCTPKHNLEEDDIKAYGKFARLHAVEVDSTVKIPDMLLNFLFSGKPYTAVRFVSKSFEKELISILTSNKFDVVQLEGLYLAPYINTIRRYSPAIVAMRAHNVEHEIWTRVARTETNPVKKLYFSSLAHRIRRLERRSLNRYDLLIPITQRDLESFNILGNTRPAQVCPAGVDAEPLEVVPSGAGTGNRPDQRSLFFLGSLDWIPNQEGILWFVKAVYPELYKRNPGLTLHIAGRNAPSWFKDRISGNGIEFHGEISDARQFMLTHGILVAPYFSGGGMRVKIAEAMSLGIPVVTTPLGAEGLDVSPNQNIVFAITVNEYLEQLGRLIKYPDFCTSIGDHARTFVLQHMDNKKIASALAGFYKQYLKCF